ncbi:MAG: nucleoside kinase [Eubacterium sp.]|nr:nucleoside kinase [Eubacterium sp.]
MVIQVENERVSCEAGTTLYEISRRLRDRYPYPILVAKVDGVLQELYHTVTDGSDVEFITAANEDGRRAYIRGLSMVMMKALNEFETEEPLGVTVDFSLDSGLYCELQGATTVTEEFLAQLTEKMTACVKENLLFVKNVIRRKDAEKYFHSVNMLDKEELMRYRSNSRTTVYQLGDYINYFHGAMPYSTGVLEQFRLECYGNGFVLITPRLESPDKMPDFCPSGKQYQTMSQAKHWGEQLDVSNVGALNRVIVQGKTQELMLVQEAFHEKCIADIAREVADRGCRIVTIAGPSSSGKTSFSYRLSTQLQTMGLRPHPIGLDDYFVNRENSPIDENGKHNYECLEAIDIEQFNTDLSALLRGEQVQLPTFNFITGKREYDKPMLQLQPGEILVIEGIHGLNDKLTYSIPRSDKFKIYISALTTLNLDDHSRIPTTDARLIRRIIRDARTRGSSAQRTIAMWNSVRKGEQENIFPYQEEADAMFNSSLIYELAAMKLYADPVLYQVPKDAPEYSEAQRLLKFLDYFIPIDPHDVPLNSILREFIGGGILLN